MILEGQISTGSFLWTSGGYFLGLSWGPHDKGWFTLCHNTSLAVNKFILYTLSVRKNSIALPLWRQNHFKIRTETDCLHLFPPLRGLTCWRRHLLPFLKKEHWIPLFRLAATFCDRKSSEFSRMCHDCRNLPYEVGLRHYCEAHNKLYSVNKGQKSNRNCFENASQLRSRILLADRSGKRLQTTGPVALILSNSIKFSWLCCIDL